MTQDFSWWWTPLPLLKIMQLMCSLLIILFLLDGRIQWTVYTLLFLLALALCMGNAILLLLHFFRVPQTTKNVPWVKVELIWNFVHLLLHVIFFAILVWDWVKMKNNQWQHHNRLPPKNIGSDGWMSRILIITIYCLVSATIPHVSFLIICCLVNSLLFFILLFRLRKHNFQ